MGLFDKLRRGADEPDAQARSSPPPRADQQPPSPAPPEVMINLADPPEDAAPPGPPTPSPNKLKRFGYDPEAPGQTPVSGIDLITFATVTRRLRDLPVDHHRALLEDHGHTPESWSAVRTVWMARMGQLPFLCDVYEAAYQSA